MAERLHTKRQCFLCGRYGTRAFRFIGKSTVHGVEVGGFWVCSGKIACYGRRELTAGVHKSTATGEES